ncbi:Restriction endonuclease BglII [Desulfarculus baarsii DSM 2075]|uniref:Restriction endonuclease BglII n=1 Tax=Desulfarculus baarsii (strain ATCC 33931 / DSM 2075 / LMG 7858 / VKM B-1802 / 2st14) TaxID=644282 RepID=E1QKV1_DESB2|nr:BglII/BstYI family type II restriction endonuclease [Desulfarculus baarsii]ADK86310.1 Restriction endonuclease BglII [Desulfarculus baarsii DSM 2075]
MFEKLKERGFDVKALHHAEAILKHDMPSAVTELEAVLLEATIPIEELVLGGGGEGGLTQRLRKKLTDEFGWAKHKFEIKKIIDGVQTESTSHELDHVKKFAGGAFALEIEWNNKDPFYDRDLDSFKRLHAEGAISIGGIITRGASLHEGMRDLIEAFAAQRGISGVDELARYYNPTSRQRKLIERSVAAKGSFARGWAHVFVSDKFGEATTHWRKLEDRVNRGVGNPCPLLLIGIPRTVVVF